MILMPADGLNQVFIANLIMFRLIIVSFSEAGNEGIITSQAVHEENGKLIGRMTYPRVAEVNNPFQLPFIIQVNMIFGQVIMDKAAILCQGLALEGSDRMSQIAHGSLRYSNFPYGFAMQPRERDIVVAARRLAVKTNLREQWISCKRASVQAKLLLVGIVPDRAEDLENGIFVREEDGVCSRERGLNRMEFDAVGLADQAYLILPVV